MIEWYRVKNLEICEKEHERVYFEVGNIRLHQSSMNRDERVVPSIYNNLILSEGKDLRYSLFAYIDTAQRP